MTIIRPTDDAIGGGMADQSDLTYLEQTFGLDYDAGRIILSILPQSFTITLRLAAPWGRSGMYIRFYSMNYEFSYAITEMLFEESELVTNFTSEIITRDFLLNLLIMSETPLDGTYAIRLGDETFGNVPIHLCDWWITTEGGIPPMRQRARNDGLTTDTRQERSHHSSSQKLDLWWVGRSN